MGPQQLTLAGLFRTPPRAARRGGGAGAGGGEERGPHVGPRPGEAADAAAGGGGARWAGGAMEDPQARLLEGYLEAYRDAGPRAYRRGARRRGLRGAEGNLSPASTPDRRRSSRTRAGAGGSSQDPDSLALAGPAGGAGCGAAPWEGGARAERDGQRFLEITSRLVEAGTHPGRALPAQVARIALQAWAHGSPHLSGEAVQTMELCRRMAPPVGPVGGRGTAHVLELAKAGDGATTSSREKPRDEGGDARIWLDPSAWCPAEGWCEAEAMRAGSLTPTSQSTPGPASQPVGGEFEDAGGDADEEERADEVAALGREMSSKERRACAKVPGLRQWVWLTGLVRSAHAAATGEEFARPTGSASQGGEVAMLRFTIGALQEDLGLRAAAFRRYGDVQILQQSLLHRLLSAAPSGMELRSEEARRMDGVLTRRHLCRLLVELAMSPGLEDEEEPDRTRSKALQEKLDALVGGADAGAGGPPPVQPPAPTREELGALGGALLEMVLDLYSALEDAQAYVLEPNKLQPPGRNQRKVWDAWMVDLLELKHPDLTPARNEFLRALTSPAHKMRLLTQLAVGSIGRNVSKKNLPLREQFPHLRKAVDPLQGMKGLADLSDFHPVPLQEILDFILLDFRTAVQSVFLTADTVALVTCHGTLCWLRDRSLDPGLDTAGLRDRLGRVSENLRGLWTPGKRKRTHTLSDEAEVLLAVAEAFVHATKA